MTHNACLRETLRSAAPAICNAVAPPVSESQHDEDDERSGSLTLAIALFYDAQCAPMPPSPPSWMAQALALPTIAARCEALLLPWRASCNLLLPRSLPAEDALIEARVQELCEMSLFRTRIEANAASLRDDALRVQSFLSEDPVAAAFSAWAALASWELARRLPPPSHLFGEVGIAAAARLSSICDEGGLR